MNKEFQFMSADFVYQGPYCITGSVVCSIQQKWTDLWYKYLVKKHHVFWL